MGAKYSHIKNWDDWSIYPENTNYAVSKDGRIIRVSDKNSGIAFKELKQYQKDGHYFSVTLFRDGKRRTTMVHKMVVEAFIRPVPKGMHVNHIDGNKSNNVLSNLEIVTPKQNMKHAAENGLITYLHGENHGSSKLTQKQVDEMRSKYVPYKYTARMIADEYGISYKWANTILNGRAWNYES